MSALEQSLDAIIASDSRSKRNNNSHRKGKAVSGNASRSHRGRASVTPAVNKKRIQATAAKSLKKRQQQQANKVVAPSALNYAQKVVVTGLPKDIKTDAVKVCFQDYY
ncbi:unnamed protein product [Ambrosiozyma monospora]|uniref:Unnamed protein product n=1 Tax=Ambrosiozyma monospora TaxID=43982 RepID=A0ACB5T9X0_AMBMO|nr:unnamed protein product [Ambrosiozyma monospora]